MQGVTVCRLYWCMYTCKNILNDLKVQFSGTVLSAAAGLILCGLVLPWLSMFNRITNLNYATTALHVSVCMYTFKSAFCCVSEHLGPCSCICNYICICNKLPLREWIYLHYFGNVSLSSFVYVYTECISGPMVPRLRQLSL